MLCRPHDSRSSAVRALLAAMALTALGAGCSRKSDAAPAPVPAESGTAAAAPAESASQTITHKASGTKFQSPPGWAQRKDEDTILWVSPDKTAVLAFESYATGTDPGATVLQAARKMNLDGLDWKGGQREIKIGKDQIPGRTAEGDCTIKGQPATYSYATLSTGSPRSVLVLYAVQKSAPQQRKQEAIEVLRSIQRGG